MYPARHVCRLRCNHGQSRTSLVSWNLAPWTSRRRQWSSRPGLTGRERRGGLGGYIPPDDELMLCHDMTGEEPNRTEGEHKHWHSLQIKWRVKRFRHVKAQHGRKWLYIFWPFRPRSLCLSVNEVSSSSEQTLSLTTIDLSWRKKELKVTSEV